MLDISYHFQYILNFLAGLQVELSVLRSCVGGRPVCCSLLHLLGGLVNQPGFVLTMKLLQISQLNSPLFFPGPLVQSLQTNLEDNPPAQPSSRFGCHSAVLRGLSDALLMSALDATHHRTASEALFSNSVTG